ncbi:MAG: helicase-exonuclease AddAB subunit AddA [Lachnospiraceae bacterium]|nr:helicase-exonuclease AddAB subunit AddA [Lachnospiraceae bacterium]
MEKLRKKEIEQKDKEQAVCASQAVTWTPAQKQVIELRNRNILVSAAAGSGKTATLVERIIRRITEGATPLNVDQLLIVTFTKAAAAEMKERIGAALEKLREAQPENEHLQRQSLLLHNAQISTIDSFCLSVIQNYFHEIDLDPVFRIADTDELTLLEHEVMQELLEDAYEEGREEFLSFSQTYGGKHQDKNLENYILRLYHFSTSCAWPKRWLETMQQGLQEEARLQDSVWLSRLLERVHIILKDMLEINRRARELCQESDGPSQYLEALLADAAGFEELTVEKTYQGLSEGIRQFAFQALSRKSTACASEKKELVKALRDKTKDAMQTLKKDFFFQSSELMQEDMAKATVPTGELIRLTLEFARRFAEKKEEKNILDFSDVEHFALNILAEEQDGKLVARTAAKELRRQYAEIMIDEYQDSNEVQETILRSISREEDGQPNIFMVGDVKQSIYRFRLAKPELFMEKYHSYSKEEGLYQRIDLQQNFRSRKEVLYGVNELFFRIMGQSFGGVEYDAAAALYPGRDYFERKGAAIDNHCELICLEEDEEKEAVSEELEEYGAREQEALCTARLIQKLMAEFTVAGKEGARPCRYGDIVILLRTMSGWAEVYAKILGAQGIPVIAETQSGYFEVLEIKWLLNYLRVIDNPRQDIPLVSVLLSPFAGLTENELVAVKTEAEETTSMWECICNYSEQGKEEALKEKLRVFLRILQQLRGRTRIVPVSELLEEIYALTGYDSYVAAMPAGEQRYQNLRAFAGRAAAFEKSSYRGLFQFIRYVERLIKYDIDSGEAATGAEQENAVRIMSIHKSKGLEFPVVIAGGMTKRFNLMDTRERVIFHPEYGVAMDYIDEEARTRVATLKKKVLQTIMTEETLGEELRILYVALTRAKEKLYLTGYVKDYDKRQEKWLADRPEAGGQVSYLTLSKAGCYMDFIGPVKGYLRYFREQQVYTSVLRTQQKEEQESAGSGRERLLRLCDAAALQETPELAEQRAAVRKSIEEYLAYEYPYEKERQLPLKLSVSELKKRAYGEDEFEPVVLAGIQEEATEESTEQGLVPEFLKQQETVKGTDRGTLYHRLLECLPVTYGKSCEVLEGELASLLARGRLTQEERQLVSVKKLAGFYASGLAERMERAAAEGKLFQEQAFVFGIPARELYDVTSEETVLIQGIIDVFFEEDGELVLVDYKTDRLTEHPEETLLRRYALQLRLYKRALEQITGKRVKEMLLYSFALQKTVKVDEE